MLRALSRTQAFAVAVALVVLAALSLTIRPAEDEGAIGAKTAYSDVRLYADVARAVAGGEGYYRAATRLQRAHGFPTRPFVTIRQPTLTWAEAALGEPAMRLALALLIAASAFAWFAALRPLARLPEAVTATLLILAGSAMATQADLVFKHELWAGVLVSLAIALRARGWLAPALIAAAAALAVRELALPFVVIAGVLSLHRRDGREAAAWATLLALYAVALGLHRGAVEAAVLPGDLSSQGWSGMRGIGAPLRDFADVSLLHLMPQPLGCLFALLALVGFLAAPPRLARLALPWLATIALLLSMFARPVNFYWAIMAMPTLPAGLAFLPQALMDLARTLRRP